MTIVVYGSINMDLVTRTPHLPVAGETLTGHSFVTVPGGKGANQAVACGRLGADVHMIGRVGADVFGQTLRESLRSYQVHTDDVVTVPGISSGIAAIAVDDQAENNIIVVPGANGTFGTGDLERLDHRLSLGASILMLQLEIPLPQVIEAMLSARRHHVAVMLDPAPVLALPDELYPLVDIITPNEVEVSALVGFPVRTESDAERASEILMNRGVRRVIIKMGSKGAYCRDQSSALLMPAFPVVAVDTVAAGDAFNGGLAVALDEGLEFRAAVYWGLAVGALSVTKAGAQPSMPDRDSVLTLLRERVDRGES